MHSFKQYIIRMYQKNLIIMIKIEKIGIIGSGKMGPDIYNYLYDYNYKLVLLCENNIEQQKHEKILKRRLNRQLKNGLINQKTFETKSSNFFITDKTENLSGCQLIIEAITENHTNKSKLFKKINSVLNDNCIIASNSSSIIPSTLIPDKTRETNTIGLHFFYPVKIKNIVEFIYTDKTSNEVIGSIDNLLEKINKFSIKLDEKNSFVLNKVFLEFQAIAFQILNEYNISHLQLDNLIKDNLFNIGIFDFFDSVGIDIMYNAICEYIKNYENKKTYEPMLIELKKLIKSGKFGIKSGSGFYNYKNNNITSEIQNSEFENHKKDIIEKLKYVYLNSVFKVIENKICSEDDINYALKEYMNMDIGPVDIAKSDGFKKIYKTLMNFYEQSKNEAYNPSNIFLEL